MNAFFAGLMRQLKSQSSHSSFILFAILMCAASATGVDIMGLAGHMTEILNALVALGTASAAAKMLLPDAPTEVKVINVPPTASTEEIVEKMAETPAVKP